MSSVSTRDDNRLLLYLAISLALHAFAVVVFIILAAFGFVSGVVSQKPPELPNAPRLVMLQPKRPQQFVETDPSQESKEKPKNAPFYSDRSTVAQDQAQKTDQNKPEIKGHNNTSPSTKDVVMAQSSPPSPPVSKTPPPQPEKQKQEKAAQNKPDEPTKKEVAVFKSNTVPAAPVHPEDLPVEAQNVDPREIETQETARAPPSPPSRAPNRSIPTAASNVSGGISRKGVIAFDTMESPSGRYDKLMFQAIGQRWYSLVGDRYRNQAGNVKVQFLLGADGRVLEVKVDGDNSVGLLLQDLCRQAVYESAPFNSFPDNLRPIWGDSRRVTIVFQYSL